jgi:hypothetical protein
MVSKKDRRHSGWISIEYPFSKKEMIKYNILPQLHYSDWDDWRDGQRDYLYDYKLIKKVPSWADDEIRTKRNAKQKKLLKRRKAKKEKAKWR